MSQSFEDSFTSPRTAADTRAAAGRFDALEEPSSVRQNEVGDVIVDAGIGEVVLLPRLWGFELSSADGARLELDVADAGLLAVAERMPDGGVRVAEVVGRPAVRRRIARTAS